MMLWSLDITLYEWNLHGCYQEVYILKIVNVEILQHVLVIKYFGFNRRVIRMGDYRNRLIIKNLKIKILFFQNTINLSYID